MRKSNIELMRILLFFMVVSIHVSGMYLSSHNDISEINWHISNLMDGFSRPAVDCFVLISGYFLCKSKKGSMHQIKKLILPIIFYLALYYPMYLSDTSKTAVQAFLIELRDFVSNNGYFYHMWFIQVILILYLLSPYLNIWIDSLNKKQHFYLMLLFFIFSSLIGSIELMTGMGLFNADIYRAKILLFITLYLIGAYIRRFDLLKNLSSAALLFMSIGFGTAVSGLTCIYNSSYSPLLIFSGLIGEQTSYPFKEFVSAVYSFSNVFVICGAVSLFLWFLRFEFTSRFINRIAGLTFGAYIVHVLVMNYTLQVLPLYEYSERTMYPASACISVLIIGFVSLFIEQIRLLLFYFIKKLKGAG